MGERDLSLPRGAQGILDARAQGLKPAEMVVVSYVGDTGWPNPHVYADSGKAYDWRWLKGLEVALVVKPGIDATDVVFALADPLRIEDSLAYPLFVDIEREEVACIVPGVRGPKLMTIERGSSMWKQVFE